MQHLLSVENLKIHFPVHGGVFKRQIGAVRAVDDVSLTIAPGETLGLVGESGCGKSTLGKAIVRLYQPNAGRISFQGEDITKASQSKIRPLRREMQMIFQDPSESLNARHSVRSILEEPFLIHGIGTKEHMGRRVTGSRRAAE